jgi:serine/threonine-protein kinase
MCLYELLTGHMPYHTEDELDVLKRLMGPDPCPRFDVALPPQIERILRKALVKDPRNRYESCAQMRRAVEGAMHELGVAADSEHVAHFLEASFPDLASKRAETIAKAIQAAESRLLHAESLESLGSADLALAATEVSARDRTVKDSEPPATRRDGRRAVDSEAERAVSSSYGASRTTSATSLRAQLGERKKRGGLALWIAALVVIGAGSWILWPRPPAVATGPTSQAPSAASSTPSVPPPSASVAASAAPSAASAEDAAAPEQEALAETATPTAAHTRSPASTVGHTSVAANPHETVDSAAAAPTYNPAWSILTHPPDAGVLPSPSSSASAAPTAPPAAGDQ